MSATAEAIDNLRRLSDSIKKKIHEQEQHNIVAKERLKQRELSSSVGTTQMSSTLGSNRPSKCYQGSAAIVNNFMVDDAPKAQNSQHSTIVHQKQNSSILNMINSGPLNRSIEASADMSADSEQATALVARDMFYRKMLDHNTIGTGYQAPSANANYIYNY